jgi:hypothetical protein
MCTHTHTHTHSHTHTHIDRRTSVKPWNRSFFFVFGGWVLKARAICFTGLRKWNEFFTSDCGKRVLLGIYFYNYFDNYFSVFVPERPCWYKNLKKIIKIIVKVNSEDDHVFHNRLYYRGFLRSHRDNLPASEIVGQFYCLNCPLVSSFWASRISRTVLWLDLGVWHCLFSGKLHETLRPWFSFSWTFRVLCKVGKKRAGNRQRYIILVIDTQDNTRWNGLPGSYHRLNVMKSKHSNYYCLRADFDYPFLSSW